MQDHLANSPNAREAQYWNSAATRPWAELYEKIDTLFAEMTETALDGAALQPGERVIDIGCGSGTTVLELARRVGPAGRVLGVDVSEPSVETARRRIAAAGVRNADVVLSDASSHAFAPESFDLVFSRFGIMFFADPIATFTHVRRALKRSGRLAFMVFRKPQENPWSTGPAAAVRHLLPPVTAPGPEDPGQYSWADPARVRRILEGAGFRDVVLTPYDTGVRLAGPGGAAEAADFTMHIGPVVRALSSGSVERPDLVRAGLEEFFAKHDTPQGVVLPAALWLVAAQA